MKKTESLFIGLGLGVAIAGAGLYYFNRSMPAQTDGYEFPVTPYGAFLAAQHAVYVNDFDQAARLVATFDETVPAVVTQTKILAEFLSGRMPAGGAQLASDKGTASRMIYDTYLIQNDKWPELYKRHKSDESAIMAPLRIWASVAAGHPKEAIKFINKLNTHESWKAFVRGQIYVETGDLVRATAEFDAVKTDFMNINDYLYLVAFYSAHGMSDAADSLRADFTSRPGSLYLQNYIPTTSWENYAGTDNQLVFSLIQNVSHTTILMYSDLSLMMLRMAEIIRGGADDTINYYLGQYFYNNDGNYARFFEGISPSCPLRPFADLRLTDGGKDITRLAKTVSANPLFVPGVSRLIAHYVQLGDYSRAMRVVNAALANAELPDTGRAFFLKTRAQINLTFHKLDAAQSDIRAASDLVDMDPDIWSIQARIWAAQKRELDNAYDYAMTLVRKNATDVNAWDTLGRVVAVRDGIDVALDLLTRVGEVSSTCSSLFEQLGDLHAAQGDWDAARDAYARAIDLSSDGLSVRPVLEKKLRKLK